MTDEATPSIDISRAPIGEVVARALVRAVAATDDRAERHYLEVKSDVDLSTALGGAKVAKFILGASNRSVELAARAFGGYGVLVIGVEPGGTPGIPPVEVLALETRIRPFLSATGPAWDVVRVPLASDREVLLILVDPPRLGQDAYLCWKDFSPSGTDAKHGLRNGTTYIRVEGATRPATADEIVLLRERGSEIQHEVDLNVAVVGEAARVVRDGGVLLRHIGTTRERLIERMVRARAVEQVPEKPPTSFAEIGAARSLHKIVAQPVIKAASAFGSLQEPEDRSPDDYRKAVDAWADHAKSAVSRVLDDVTAGIVAPIILRVTNRGSTYFEDVELTLHLAGDVEGVDPQDGDVPRGVWLPHPPRAWGPRTRIDWLGSQVLGHYTPSMPYVGPPSRLTYENGGSINVRIGVGDLRPRATFETDADEGLVVLVRDPAMAVVDGTWAVTARGHHERYEGELKLPIAEAREMAGFFTDRLRAPKE